MLTFTFPPVALGIHRTVPQLHLKLPQALLAYQCLECCPTLRRDRSVFFQTPPSQRTSRTGQPSCLPNPPSSHDGSDHGAVRSHPRQTSSRCPPTICRVR